MELLNTIELANHKDCTGCLACVDACSKAKALSYKVEVDGHWYPQVDTSICLGCHLCEKTCPIINGLSYSKSEISEYYAAWCKDSNVRKTSATAGAFSAMALWVLDKGGVVVGATIENKSDVKHIIIETKQELYKLQGSKYTQSDTSGIYKKTFDLLKNGRLVLFSGLGCQVAGLYLYIGSKRYTGELITVDLICGGIPSKHLLNKFVENEPYKIKRIISFRTKENGWKPTGFRYNLKTEDSEGIIHDYTGKRTLLTDGFSSELTNRYSCYQCNFAGESRMSDFTIGDLWGDQAFPEQHHEGVSLVIVHSERAKELLFRMSDYMEIHQTDRNKAVERNFRIRKTNSKKGLNIERRWMPWIMEHCSYSTLKKIYAWDYGKTSPWMLFKVYQKIMQKILR